MNKPPVVHSKRLDSKVVVGLSAPLQGLGTQTLRNAKWLTGLRLLALSTAKAALYYCHQT
jgi:hypothetical protein